MRYLTHIVFTCSLYFFSQGHALATGTFMPAEGAEITQNPFTVSWETTAPQQWVRAYDATSGAKFFDSGRLRSESGSISVSIPDNISEVSVIYYEYTSSWMQQQRTYSVNLADMGSGGSVTVSERISCSVRSEGYMFGERDLLTNALDPGIGGCTLQCPEGDYLISVDCNAGVINTIGDYFPSDGVELSFFSENSARCELWFVPPFDPDNEDFIFLGSSGACMSLPD